MTKLIPFLAIAILALPGARSSANGGAKVYVTNSEGDDLTVIDAGTFKVLGSIKVGDRPHGLTPSPDGHILYVSIEGTNARAASPSSGKITNVVASTSRCSRH